VRTRARALIALLACSSVGYGLVVGIAAPASAKSLPRYRFIAPPGSSILVHGTYPVVTSRCRAPVQPLLHVRFNGIVEVGKDIKGKLFVINILPFEDYLKGIAEVPRTWPMESLKAQVVAARSYALAHQERPGSEGARLGYQICATTACQVYLGLGIGNGPYGGRWRDAVSHTAGQVLLYAGRPADTLYSSTSNGHTIGNDQVFGSSPLPYLRPVVERDDGGSPLSHWKTRISHADVGRFLRAAGDWSSKPISQVARKGDRVIVRGGGASTSLSVTQFRSDINAWAHCLAPAVYPTVDSDGRLPQTIPSKWFTTSTIGKAVLLKGRGWGHGVGMIQWGAEGKARRGLSYRDILAYYYGGLRPQPYSEPEQIKVGVAVGLRSVVIEGTGDVTVEGKSLGPGPWLVSGGKRIRIQRASPPPRYIAPARVIEAPKRLRAGGPVSVTVSLPQLSVARLALRTGSSQIPFGKPLTFRAGLATLRARTPAVPSGKYGLEVVVTNGIDIVNTRARDVRVTGSVPTPSPSPPATITPSATLTPTASATGAAAPAAGSGGSASLFLLAGIIAAVVAVGLFLFAVRRSRR
jgi:stage II sporulation protein D (peptidoglycan lytic transglycosylase)